MKFFDRLMGKQNGDEMSIREAISVAATDFGNARHEADKKTIDYRMKIAADKDHIRQDAAKGSASRLCLEPLHGIVVTDC